MWTNQFIHSYCMTIIFYLLKKAPHLVEATLGHASYTYLSLVRKGSDRGIQHALLCFPEIWLNHAATFSSESPVETFLRASLHFSSTVSLFLAFAVDCARTSDMAACTCKALCEQTLRTHAFYTIESGTNAPLCTQQKVSCASLYALNVRNCPVFVQPQIKALYNGTLSYHYAANK